ncbi:MAG TPA: SpoIID/LytB domain-containing protein [Vicinamibacterales bacterium]|nr:SpoIID/LytB domain-containing protein [Vicinamibacterales bacterium]
MRTAARLIVSLLCAAAVGCSARTVRIAPPSAIAAPRVPETIRVQTRDGGRLVVRRIPLEEYVTATLIAEFDPPSGDPPSVERMLQLQAIISRTYATANVGRHERDGFDLCSTSHCQIYDPARLRTSRWAALAREAAARTRGEVLWYGNGPANAVFHADCGGHTSAAADVWGGRPVPYLVGAPDDGPARDVHATWRVDLSRVALRGALDADPRTAVGGRLDAIDVTRRDAAGRAVSIEIRGARTVTVRGDVFREAVTRRLGVSSLRSTLFTVRRTRAGFAFDGRGFGHGVGLCQVGAFARVRAGASIADVLRHYFPGTVLVGAVSP